MPTRYPADQRRRDLATIHLAKKQLGLDDETYRDVLWTVARVRSSADLDQAGRNKLLDHFKSRGWKYEKKAKEWGWVNKAAEGKRKLLWKIRRCCIEIGIDSGKQKGYAEGVAKRQHHVDRKLEMMDEGELWMLAAALEKTRLSKERA